MKKNILSDFFVKKPEFFTLLIITVYFAIISSINSDFFSVDTMIRILFNGIMLFFITIGISSVIITKNIDVSVGSLMGLSATIGGTVLNQTNNTTLAILAALGVGILGGLFNGIGVAYLGVTAIIMTLGTMAIFRGLLIMFTGGAWIQNVPDFFTNFSRLKFLGLNLSIWIFFVVLVGLWYFFSKTKIGRYFYAVGNNKEGAKLQGISVKPIIVFSFVISGLMAGLAAIFYISQIGAVPNQAGNGMETQAIAAAVIGGISLTGGKGNVIGAFLGAVLLQTINYSLVYLKVPGYWNNAISGFLLLFIIVFSTLLQKYIKKERERAKDRKIREDYFKSIQKTQKDSEKEEVLGGEAN